VRQVPIHMIKDSTILITAAYEGCWT